MRHVSVVLLGCCSFPLLFQNDAFHLEIAVLGAWARLSFPGHIAERGAAAAGAQLCLVSSFILHVDILTFLSFGTRAVGATGN